MESFGIIGAGVMGTDVAHLAAESGFKVLIYDINESNLSGSIEIIQQRLKSYEEKARITPDKIKEILSNIKPCTKMDKFKDADIVMESVTEDLEIKKSVFKEIDRVCKGGALLATNTSSISITAIASATHRPESVIGMHFLIPARVMKLVELVRGFSTTVETLQMAKAFLKKLGKIYIESKDFPGFLSNRIFMLMINEAVYALYEGAGTIEAIDRLMTEGMNMPMGPLKVADLIGLDVVLAIMEVMYNGFSDQKYRPCPLLKKYVAAGRLGKKTGKGFYNY